MPLLGYRTGYFVDDATLNRFFRAIGCRIPEHLLPDVPIPDLQGSDEEIREQKFQYLKAVQNYAQLCRNRADNFHAAFRHFRNTAAPEVKAKLIILHSTMRAHAHDESWQDSERYIPIRQMKKTFVPTGMSLTPIDSAAEQDIAHLDTFIEAANKLIPREDQREAGGFKASDFTFAAVREETVWRPYFTPKEIEELQKDRELCALYGTQRQDLFGPYF